MKRVPPNFKSKNVNPLDRIIQHVFIRCWIFYLEMLRLNARGKVILKTPRFFCKHIDQQKMFWGHSFIRNFSPSLYVTYGLPVPSVVRMFLTHVSVIEVSDSASSLYFCFSSRLYNLKQTQEDKIKFQIPNSKYQSLLNLLIRGQDPSV